VPPRLPYEVPYGLPHARNLRIWDEPAPSVRVGHHGVMKGLDYQVKDGKSSWGGRVLRDWVQDVTALIVEEFQPASVILFGSVADGTDGPDSDVDLLVVLDEAPAHRRRDLMVELRRATRRVDIPRDLLVTSVADFERNRDAIGTTEYEPAHHGVVVYERRSAA
jgi:predicted nucleotidyltransferase